MLTNLINQFDLSLCYALKCYTPVFMPTPNRTIIRDMFMKLRRNDTMYVMVMMMMLMLIIK